MPNGSTSPRGAAHREHEKRTGAYDENWPDWYSAYMAAEQSGTELPTCHQPVRAADLATRLGADEYIDSNATDPGAALQAMGGAATIVATAATGASMSPLVSGPVSGLAPGGRLVVVGAAPDPIEVQTSQHIFGTRSVAGSLTGSSIENEDNLRLVQRLGIRSMNEVLPLSDAPKAYERMLSGQARFRMVLDTRA